MQNLEIENNIQIHSLCNNIYSLCNELNINNSINNTNNTIINNNINIECCCSPIIIENIIQNNFIDNKLILNNTLNIHNTLTINCHNENVNNIQNNITINDNKNEQQKVNNHRDPLVDEGISGMKASQKKIFCGNCGLEGHIYKECTEPIISLGIIAFTQENNENKYLLIRRKDTYAYVEFIRGKYTLQNLSVLTQILENMTNEEREEITKYDMEYLWKKLWKIDNIKDHRSEYEMSKIKFQQIKNGFNHTKYTSNGVETRFVNLELLLKETKAKWEEPEWGFPKGRRNIKENDFDCANREFREETSCTNNDYEMMQCNPIIEDYSSDNNIHYRHIYYIAKWKKELELKINKDNKLQFNEVSAIGFFNYNECIRKFRPYHTKRIILLTELENKLKNNFFNLNSENNDNEMMNEIIETNIDDVVELLSETSENSDDFDKLMNEIVENIINEDTEKQ